MADMLSPTDKAIAVPWLIPPGFLMIGGGVDVASPTVVGIVDEVCLLQDKGADAIDTTGSSSKEVCGLGGTGDVKAGDEDSSDVCLTM